MSDLRNISYSWMLIAIVVVSSSLWLMSWILAHRGDRRGTVTMSLGGVLGVPLLFGVLIFLHFETGGGAGFFGECLTCERNNFLFNLLFLAGILIYCTLLSLVYFSGRDLTHSQPLPVSSMRGIVLGCLGSAGALMLVVFMIGPGLFHPMFLLGYLILCLAAIAPIDYSTRGGFSSPGVETE